MRPSSNKFSWQFPWRILTRLVFVQFFLMLFAVGFVEFSARHFLKQRFQTLIDHGVIPASELAQNLKAFDTSFIALLCLVSLMFIAFAFWLGHDLVSPVNRLLSKVEAMLDRDSEALVFERPDKNEIGEWSELESSLDDIRRDLETKVEALVLEREQQATLMGAISDAILAVDPEGSPLFYNSRFAMLFGKEELKQRKHLFELFREPEILEAFQSAIRENKPSSVLAIPVEQPSGRHYFSISVSPLRASSKNRESQIYGAVGIFHDVTDLKRAEQMRIDFVANVSHELRTPLTAIKGYADTLADDVASGRTLEKDYLSVITRNTDRLMSLIQDLLDLSSLESTDTLNKSHLSTAEITERVLHQMKNVFESKKQEIEIDVGSPHVLADSRRLEQILVNLLDNASKYTPSGGKIRVSWEGSGSGDTLLKVKDTGSGIGAEHHLRLFERFYRVDKARSRELGGTGLGLAIVKHIMQRHGGTISVNSIVGQGAEFICRFPVGF